MPDTHSCHDIVSTKKKHQADLKKRQEELDDCKAEVKAERFIQEEASEQASKSSHKGKKKTRSVEIMMNALQEKLMGEINQLRTQQDDKIQGLEDSNAKLSASLEHFSAVVCDLHRRMVLDDARSLLSTRYGYTPISLRPGYQEADGQPAKSLGQLVKEVRLKLNQDDARLLPDEALKMIFDSSHGTVRREANKVAHRASAEDLTLAITRDDLTALQTKTLQGIYEFAHHEIP